MAELTQSENQIRLAVAVPESQRSTVAAAIAQCPSFQVVATLIPAGGLSREWKAVLRSRKASPDIEDIINDPDVEALLATDRHSIHDREILVALRAGKSALASSSMFQKLEQLDSMLDAASTADSGLMILMPWRFNDVLQNARAAVESRGFGENPQATFRSSIDPRIAQDPLLGFVTSAVPEFEIANWLFGPVQAVSADLDFISGRGGAVIASHPDATVVHHFVPGNSGASLRIQGRLSESKIDAAVGGWGSIGQDITARTYRSNGGRGSPKSSVNCDSPLSAQLEEFVRNWGDYSFQMKNLAAYRSALEAALAAVAASNDGAKVTLPLSCSLGSWRNVGSAGPPHLPATVSK